MDLNAAADNLQQIYATNAITGNTATAHQAMVSYNATAATATTPDPLLALMGAIIKDPAYIPVGATVRLTEEDPDGFYSLTPFRWGPEHRYRYIGLAKHVQRVGVLILGVPARAPQPALAVKPTPAPPLPPLKCAPDCTPAAPCFWNRKCPGADERLIADGMGFSNVGLCRKEVPDRLVPCDLVAGHLGRCCVVKARPRTGFAPLHHEGLAGLGVLSQGVRR